MLTTKETENVETCGPFVIFCCPCKQAMNLIHVSVRPCVEIKFTCNFHSLFCWLCYTRILKKVRYVHRGASDRSVKLTQRDTIVVLLMFC